MSADERTYTEREVVLRERDAINEAVEWLFREARAAGRKGDGGIEGVDARNLAAILRPLPEVTRPRVVADPHDAGEWSVGDSLGRPVVQQRYRPSEAWRTSDWSLLATRERVALWADLLANPTEEVEA